MAAVHDLKRKQQAHRVRCRAPQSQALTVAEGGVLQYPLCEDVLGKRSRKRYNTSLNSGRLSHGRRSDPEGGTALYLV